MLMPLQLMSELEGKQICFLSQQVLHLMLVYESEFEGAQKSYKAERVDMMARMQVITFWGGVPRECWKKLALKSPLLDK